MKFAIDLKLPFDDDLMKDLAMNREFEPKERQQFRVDADQIPLQVREFLAENDIFLSHAEVFHTPPMSLLPLHVDGPELNNITKLNWCWGGTGSKMMWWKLRDGAQPTQLETKIGTRYLTMDAKDCVPIHSHRITKPTLVNVGQPHSVFNMTPEHRWVLCLVLWSKSKNEALRWDDAVQLLGRFTRA